MFGRLSGGRLSPEERVDVSEYFRDARPLMDHADAEFKEWMKTVAPEEPRQLSFDGDPTGQHAAVYLWRVSGPATEFVQMPVVKAARRVYEAYALCLEARAAAADLCKEAADFAAVKDPAPMLLAANKKVVEAEKEWARAQEELRSLNEQLGQAR